MNHYVYLQGSYPNHTNIRADSDVDVVVESSNVFYHNVPGPAERLQYGLTNPGHYGWEEFRHEVLLALRSYYGPSVSEGDKSIKVPRSGNRLNADVVPALLYRQYRPPAHLRAYAEGMTFWTRKTSTQIVNFPKLHRKNGETKNSQCLSRYKRSIRMFKNARNRAGSDFPSYFVECLLYNVPNLCFAVSLAATYDRALRYLEGADLRSFVCQNEQQNMIGDAPWQIDWLTAEEVVRDLRHLWRTWS